MSNYYKNIEGNFEAETLAYDTLMEKKSVKETCFELRIKELELEFRVLAYIKRKDSHIRQEYYETLKKIKGLPKLDIVKRYCCTTFDDKVFRKVYFISKESLNKALETYSECDWISDKLNKKISQVLPIQYRENKVRVINNPRSSIRGRKIV